MSFSCIKTSDHITVVLPDGESGTVNADNARYSDALEAVRNSDMDAFMLIANPGNVIHKFADDRVVIEGGVVCLDDEELHSTLADRMLEAIQDGFGIEPLANFLINLNENPSKRAVDELYDFMEANDLALTPDGHFVAYKKVRGDYMDCHSGEFDNSPGMIQEMPRNKVDEDKNRTCSAGLHFCGRSYLNSYPGDRTVIVKINPRDVVAIPSDYSNAKGRTCRYEVIGELTNGTDDDGERVEESLEGGIYSDDRLGIASSCPSNDEPPVALRYYSTEEIARAWADEDEKYWDFGKWAPFGYRHALIKR